MTMSSIQNISKGDIIVERVNGKNRMTPVRKVEFNACSSMGVHINTSMCYDFNAVVQLADAEGTVKDLEEAIEDLNVDVKQAINEFDEMADIAPGTENWEKYSEGLVRV